MVEIQSHNDIRKPCYHTLYVWATECFHTCMLCYSISSLKNLEVLSISRNKLSEGLPDNIFTSLLSLRELNMEKCKLSTLPNMCVLYYSVGSLAFHGSIPDQSRWDWLEKCAQSCLLLNEEYFNSIICSPIWAIKATAVKKQDFHSLKFNASYKLYA